MNTNVNNVILHIPHANTKLPSGFIKMCLLKRKEVETFNNVISDLYTDNLFSVWGCKKIKAKYSRIFCDVEKFVDDEKEIMSKFGMGFIYTHTNKGKIFYTPSNEYKEKIYKKYYLKHHNLLNKIVSRSIKKQPTILLDCHSFSKDIIMFEDKKQNLPDICIGYDELYYNENIISFIKSYFENLGYVVNLNYPYSGTMIPNRFFDNKVDNLYCVMIEINKKMYIDDDGKKNNKFKILKNQIKYLLKNLKSLEL